MNNGNIKLILRYLKYFFTARHYKGHGIHSPLIFDFAQNVLFANKKEERYKLIQTYLKLLLKNSQTIEIEDQGAGSLHLKSKKRRIKDIARTSSTQAKYGKLLSRIVDYYRPQNIIELGTSLGIGTSYLGIKMPLESKLYTIEADKHLSSIAKQHFETNISKNIISICGSFEQKLPELISNIASIDLVYFDGNHRKKPTIEHFENCLGKINNQTIFIFDDIHWSSEMEEAWDYIKLHPSTRVCIDLFQIGIVFFRKELSCEDYTIRF